MSATSTRPIILFCDWDETITSHDTLALIAPPDGEHPGVPFAEYGKAYMSHMKEHEEEWKKANQSTSKKQTQLDKLEAQLNLLQSFDSVELASQRRIEAGKLFLDCDPKGIERRASQGVEHRTGWQDFSARWLRPQPSNIVLHIVSVGWSARFIAAGLRETCTPASICANEVEVDSNSARGTGRLTKSRDAQRVEASLQDGPHSHSASMLEGRSGIRVAQHKVREMRRILAARTADAAPRPVLTVYAGDSATDLGALLEADVGLILANKGSLEKVLKDELGMTSSSEEQSIGRLFADVDGALPQLDAHLKRLQESASAPFHTDPALPRAAAQHRAFLIHVCDWHQASRVFEVMSRS